MFKLSSISFAVLVALHAPLACAQAAPATDAATQSLATRIDQLLAEAYRPGAPGASVIVVKDGKTVLRKAYGDADVAKRVPMTADMSLRLGSITKQFTAVGILLLADQGKLALTDDITRFFPDYPTKGKKITVEHLLTHSSGIFSYTSRPGFANQQTADRTVAQMVDSFKKDPLEFDAGTRHVYSNSGYFMLGAIIEKVSGMPYAKFMEQRVFVPLGMKDTAYEGHERSKVARVVGHTRNEKGFVLAAPLSMTQPYAAGALVSTVDDLARWDAAISAGKLLSAASWAKAFTPYVLADGKTVPYGYGFAVNKLHDSGRIHHDGDINGFASYALRLPEHKLYVAVLSNTEGGITPPTRMGEDIATLAMGKELPVIKTFALSNAVFDTYVGNYQLRPDLVITISRTGDKFFGAATGQGSLELKAVAENRLAAVGPPIEVRFDKGADGSITQLTLFQNGQEVPAPRVK